MTEWDLNENLLKLSYKLSGIQPN